MPRSQRYYSRARLAIDESLRKALPSVILPFLGRTLSEETIGSIARAVLPFVLRTRKRSRNLALTEIRASLKAADLPGYDDPPDLRDYDESPLVRAIVEITGDDPEFTADHGDKVVETAIRHSRNAGRNTMVQASLHHPDILGWARVDFTPPTCPICTLAISRGPVYKSARSAGERNKYHTGDTCSVVVVLRGQEDSYPGIEHTREALRLYKEARVAPGDLMDNLRKTSPGSDRKTKTPVADEVNTKIKKTQERLTSLDKMNPKSQAAKDRQTREIAKAQADLETLKTQKG